MHLFWRLNPKRHNPCEGFSPETGMWHTLCTIRVTLPEGSGIDADTVGPEESTRQMGEGWGQTSRRQKRAASLGDSRQGFGKAGTSSDRARVGAAEMSRWQRIQSPPSWVGRAVFSLCSGRVLNGRAVHTTRSHPWIGSEIASKGFNQHYFFNKRDQNRIGSTRTE